MPLRRAFRSTPIWITCLLLGSAAAGIAAFAAVDEKGFVRVTPDEIQWTSPNGASAPQVAILSGDPSKPGVYVQRVKFPPGVFSLPHTHDQDRHIAVLQGTWYTGTGETFDPEKAVPLRAGSYMKHPAGGVHWDGAKTEEVILQISGMGPVDTKPLVPEKGRYTTIGAPSK